MIGSEYDGGGLPLASYPVTAMRFLSALAFLPLLGSIGFSDTIWVPDDSPTIQGAIDAATSGDTIKVRPGVYTENVTVLLKDIVLESEQGPAVTVIDGGSGGSVVTFIAVSSYAQLRGFTLTGGTGSDGPATKGGAIYCTFASPFIWECILDGNDATWGGGIYFDDSYASLYDCTFRDLTGGGIWGASDCSLDVSQCRFENIEGIGIMLRDGGISRVQYVEMTGVDSTGIVFTATDGGTILDCSITHCGGGISVQAGGGLSAKVATSFTVGRCDVSYNTSMALSAYGRSVTVTDCSFVDNGWRGVNSDWANVTLENCLIAGHPEGGLRGYESSFVMSGCTIADNSSTYGAGAIDFERGSYYPCTIKDSILWNNTGIVGPQIQVVHGDLTLEYCNLEGGAAAVSVDPNSTMSWGPGMIDADPLFLDVAADDYRLQQDPPQSGVVNPCVDAGDPTASLPYNSTTRSDWELDTGILDLGFHPSRPSGMSRSRNPGPNPESYDDRTRPLIGTTYSLEVDLAGTTSHTFAAIAGYSSPLTLVLGGGQVLLVNPMSSGELLGMPAQPGPVAQFSVPIPLDPTLVGFELSSQAIHFGGVVPYALSNALDIEVGL